MSLDENTIKEILISELGFTPEEVAAYLYMLRIKEFDQASMVKDLNLDKAVADSIVEKFAREGLIIKSVSDDKYKCLHPRMGLTNLYKIWEQDMLVAMRRKRAKVELLVRNLTNKYESK